MYVYACVEHSMERLMCDFARSGSGFFVAVSATAATAVVVVVVVVDCCCCCCCCCYCVVLCCGMEHKILCRSSVE